VTRRDDPAWLASLAETLPEEDEFLRSPAGHASLDGFDAARGSIRPGFDAGNLIDAVSFTALWLRSKAPQARQS
jgi:hypothetical protein